MSRRLDGAGLLVVSGVSGAGKSSLLRAGVLPRVRGAGLASAPGSASWPCLLFTPARAPLDELAVRMASLAGADAAAVRRGLDADPAGFALTARQAALAQPRRAGGRSEGPEAGAAEAAAAGGRPVRAAVYPVPRGGAAAGVHHGPARHCHRQVRAGSGTCGPGRAGGARRFRGPLRRLPAAGRRGARPLPGDVDDRAAAADGHHRAGQEGRFQRRGRPGRRPAAGGVHASRLVPAVSAGGVSARGAAIAVARPGPGLAQPYRGRSHPRRL